MSFRAFIDQAEANGDLVVIEKEVSVKFEVANVANALKDKVVIFTNVKEHPGWRICANACATRDYFRMELDTPVPKLIHKMAGAISNPVTPPVVASAPCQAVVVENPQLSDLPFLFHLPTDAGHYCASAVVITEDADFGRNMCYHRLLRNDNNTIAARIIERRGTWNAMQKVKGDLPIAICIGVSLTVHLAASMGPPPEVDELSVAHALKATPLVKCITSDLHVPADAEIVIEGRITKNRAPEGPFMDLTETMDITRNEPVIEIDLITHRHNPIYHALLPGGLEHKMLMGMPKEPTIFAEVNKVVTCTGAAITPGGTSWLHAVVQIDKQSQADGAKAIEAAYRGHGSLKHVWVVDTDVDLFDSADVEWAFATRFQANKDIVLYENQRGSSLDPSGTHEKGKKSRTAKAGFDCTIPFGVDKSKFLRGEYGAVDLKAYLDV